MRQAAPAEQGGFAPTVSWLKLTLEALRTEDAGDRPGRLGSRTAVGRLAGGPRRGGAATRRRRDE